MSREDWFEAGAFLSMCAFCLGLGAAFLIDGMEWAALVGTIPGWALLIAYRFQKRKGVWV